MESLSIDRRAVLGLLAGSLVAAVIGTPSSAKDGGEGPDGGGHDEDGRDDDGNRGPAGNDDYSQDDALDDVRAGRIITLRAAMRIVDEKVGGKVIEIRLMHRLRPQYRVKLRRENGRIVIVRIDARSGRPLGKLDFER